MVSSLDLKRSQGSTESVSEGSRVKLDMIPLIQRSKATKLAQLIVDRIKGRDSLKFNRVIFMTILYNYYYYHRMFTHRFFTIMKNIQGKLISYFKCSKMGLLRYQLVNKPGYNFCDRSDHQNVNNQSLKKIKNSRINDIFTQYEKMSNSNNLFQNALIINKMITAVNKQAIIPQNLIKIQQILIQALKKIVDQSESLIISREEDKNMLGLLTLTNSVGLTSFNQILNKSVQKQEILELIRSQKVRDILLKMFPFQNLKGKSNIIKFILKFHAQNEKIKQQLTNLLIQDTQRTLIHDTNVEDLIMYMRGLVRYSIACSQEIKMKILNENFIENSIKYIYSKILLVYPKLLFILTEAFLDISKQNLKYTKNFVYFKILLQSMEQHVKGLKMIESKNMMDCIYLLQVLENLLAIKKTISKDQQKEIIRITNSIYQYIKEIYRSKDEDNFQQQQKEGNQENKENQDEKKEEEQKQSIIKGPKKMRLIDINIVLQSMLKLSVIDAKVFSILQGQFFQHINEANFNDLISYIYGRNKVIKAVMLNIRGSEDKQKAPEKLRIIKQEHTKFILKVLENLQANPTLKLTQVGKLLQSCQQIQVKSRKIKRKLKEIIDTSLAKGDINQEQAAYLQIVMQGF